MYRIKDFEKDDIPNVIEFEKALRIEEPDTYFWDPNEGYVQQLEKSFGDPRYTCSISCLAYKDEKVIGRIDASLIASRSDAACYSAYLDWISVLKSERHNKVGQALLQELRGKLKEKGVGILVALMANNEEAQRFYRKVENASIHDTGIWIEI